jgi:hypothetical protein
VLNKIDVDNLMNQLRVELTGSSDVLLRSMMYQVMTEFFDGTSYWTEWVPINAISGKHHYPITPTEGQIIRLDMVVKVKSAANGAAPADGGYFVPALMPEVGVIVAEHAPDTTEQWAAHVVLNVSLPTLKDGAPIAPEFTLKQWFLAIKHGIIGEMMNQPDKTWSNSKGALYHLSKYRSYIQQARTIKRKANTNGATAWRFPQGFRVNSQQGGVPSFGGRERTF